MGKFGDSSLYDAVTAADIDQDADTLGLWDASAAAFKLATPEAVIATGWADYVDTAYTEGAPLELAADTTTQMTNNGGTVVDTYMPADLTAMMADNKILGREGEAIGITIDFKAKPSNANTTYIEHWIDIGGSVGELYRRITTFPKGNGVERQIVTSTFAYTLDTWEENGGTVYVRANNTCDIYEIRWIIFRLTKV